MGGRSSSAATLGGLILPFLIAACAAEVRGIHHTVDRGENLFRIGKAYGVDYRRLARLNGIADPGRIEAGQRIFIPGATRRLPVTLITPRAVIERPPDRTELPPGRRPFRWPTVNGTLVSHFGPRNGAFHDGIDIAAPLGTPVFAALPGRVVYSDTLRGYGNVIIIDHDGGLATVYAHNQANEVSEGALVHQGQLVARVGQSGRASGPNLHFEIRHRNAARNPIYYLPALAPGGSPLR